MPRSDPRSQRAFKIAVGLTALAAFLPTGWLRWTSVLADIVNVPVQPLGDAGLRLAEWVRPPDGRSGAESEEFRRQTDDLETARALLHAARLRIEALHEEIGELQAARRMNQGTEINPLFARVTGHSPQHPGGPISINAGSRHGVEQGTVAVYRGVHLVGRIAEGVARLGSRVIPITDPAAGLLEAIILPAGEPLASIDGAPRLQLAPDGNGALVGDLDRAVPVRRGDLVRLSDPSWPDSAQGMIVGEVDAIGPEDLQPLLQVIVVRPRYPAHRVTSVTLKIERHDVAARESPGGGS